MITWIMGWRPRVLIHFSKGAARNAWLMKWIWRRMPIEIGLLSLLDSSLSFNSKPKNLRHQYVFESVLSTQFQMLNWRYWKDMGKSINAFIIYWIPSKITELLSSEVGKADQKLFDIINIDCFGNLSIILRTPI